MTTTRVTDGRGRAPRIPLRAFSRTEKVIAFCRILLLIAAASIIVVDPKLPTTAGLYTAITLVVYGTFSVVVFLLVRSERVRQEWIAIVSVVVDIVGITLLTLLTERGVSPFFLLHVFLISSVSVRWGLEATVRTTILLATLYPLVAYGASRLSDDDLFVFTRAHLFRPLYLLALGYLIGYLGEHERQSRRKLSFMLELLAAVRRSRPTGRTLTLLMRRLLRFLHAEVAQLSVYDPDSGRYFNWTVTRAPHRYRVGLRITDQMPHAFTFAAPTEGFLVNDLRPKRRSALCYDVVSGALLRRAIPSTLEPPVPGCQAMLASPILLQRQLHGYVVIATTTKRRFTREDLEFLLVFVGQGAAGFEAVRLQDKAEEVAVLEERARIARDLHDGFIQSLAAIDLRVEAAKLMLERKPERLPPALAELHEVVDRGYQDVRHYLTVLRNTSRPSEGFLAALDRLAAEFSLRSRVRVALSRPDVDPHLTPAMAHDLTQIVREALHNAVRHGEATQAVVKVGLRPGHVYLVVRDNGRGYQGTAHVPDADGFLPRGAEPWSIRERVETMKGDLRVWTDAGKGTEVSLWVPRQAAATARAVAAERGSS